MLKWFRGICVLQIKKKNKKKKLLLGMMFTAKI